ncbi:MAG TPA: hypothetical protein VK211_05350 [Kamptonema sp.]|nr:hypothetical protein [Kamptonema sp.]
MEEWQKSFFVVVETAVAEVEQFFTDATGEFAEMLDSLAKLSEEFTVQVQNSLMDELDEYFNELIEPLIEVFRELDPEINEIDMSLVTYVEPSPTQQPACIGCSNYHGHVYGGNLLVCGMHASGVESDICPDWEGYGGDLES